MSAIRAEALKEKKALEEAYKDGFDVIFNYGYGCCALRITLRKSTRAYPGEMSDTSKSLTLEFFINPRCPPGVIPAKAASINVCLGEITNVLERRLLLQFLRRIIAR